MNKDKNEFLKLLESHLAEIEKMLNRFNVMPLDSFYIGDMVKKFHDSLNELEDILTINESFLSLKDEESYQIFLELIKYNRIKIPLKRKFEDTRNFFSTYCNNVRKIIKQINS
jgi:hypothetical protein